jgi:hypothetical protein
VRVVVGLVKEDKAIATLHGAMVNQTITPH